MVLCCIIYADRGSNDGHKQQQTVHLNEIKTGSLESGKPSQNLRATRYTVCCTPSTHWHKVSHKQRPGCRLIPPRCCWYRRCIILLHVKASLCLWSFGWMLSPIYKSTRFQCDAERGERNARKEKKKGMLREVGDGCSRSQQVRPSTVLFMCCCDDHLQSTRASARLNADAFH